MKNTSIFDAITRSNQINSPNQINLIDTSSITYIKRLANEIRSKVISGIGVYFSGLSVPCKVLDAHEDHGKLRILLCQSPRNHSILTDKIEAFMDGYGRHIAASRKE